MKKCLVITVLLLFASMPGFTKSNSGSHAQPSRFSQFGINRSRLKSATAHKLGHRASVSPHGLHHPELSKERRSTSEILDKHARSMVRTGCAAARTRKFTSSCPAAPTFLAAARFPWGGLDDDETEAVVGDFNGDGKMDVARIVTDTNGNPKISVVLGNGDGTFQAPQLTAAPADTDGPLLVGDVNGDSKDDLVLAQPVEPGGVYVMLSNGDGTFAAANNGNLIPATEVSLVGGLLTDINGDGKLDVLAFDNGSPANVIEMLGNGDGTFQAASTLGQLTTSAPNNMIFADFNGDGKIDFAGQLESGQLQVTLATGVGLFANAPVSLTTEDGGFGACNSTTGDLTGDSKPEIVSFNCRANTVTVYVNNGDGTFATGLYYNNIGDQAQIIENGAIADMNGDGKNDIVAINDDTADISVFLGHGDGTVSVKPLTYDVGGFAWTTPLIADFNGDGLMDVVEPDDIYNLVYLQGFGDGTFLAAPTYDLPNSFATGAFTFSVATGDFNGDGIPDVVAGQFGNAGATGVAVYLGKGDGTFSHGLTYGSSIQDIVVAVGDFNGDGKLDIAALDGLNDLVVIFLGNGDGTFSIGPSYAPSSNPNPNAVDLVVGDFNKDGKLDLAVANSNSGDVGVLLGRGDGTFADAVSYPITGFLPECIAAADINGDGNLDIAVCAASDGPAKVGILLGDNTNLGTFHAVAFTDINGAPNTIAFGDLNGDGKADMAVAEFNGVTFSGQIEVFLGDGSGTFSTVSSTLAASTFGGATGDSFPENLKVADINGDGNQDLVYVNDRYGTLGVILGDGTGNFSAAAEFPTTEFTVGLAIADLNGDGALDVITGDDDGGGFSVFLNGAGSGAQGNYSIGTSTPSQTVASGSSASYTLDLAGSNGYTGTITFACTNLPTGAACSFSPSSIVANGDTPFTTTMTVTTTASTASLLRPVRPGSKPLPPTLLACLGGMGLFGLILAGGGRNGRQRRAAILLGMMLLLMLTVVACDNENTAKKSTGTAAGAYLVTVTSTGTGTGAPTHSLNVTLVVQ